MTTTTITLQGKARTGSGKGPAGRVRARGSLPAIVYGPGAPARSIEINPRDVRSILASPLGRNTLVTLSIDGQSTLALLKNYEHHPLTREVLHADFYTVTLDRPITVQVPFLLTGKSKGVATQGGILRQIFRTLPVQTTADKIPARIEADVTALELGQSLHVRELTLPAGVTVKLDQGQTIVSVVAPEKDEARGAGEAAAAAATPAAGAAPAGKAAAAPAGKAAAPAAKDAKAAAPAAKDAKKK